MSAGVDRAFGGHLLFVATVAVLYGFEWTLSLWTELGYSYDRFASLAWTLSTPTALWAAGALLLGLWIDTRTARADRTDGQFKSTAVVLAALGVLVAYMIVAFPAERTIQATFQTRTASGGYFKDALQIFLLLWFSSCRPFTPSG
jgi:hypothetical protein